MAEQQSVQRGVSKQFTFMSFVWRFLAALALVLLTYNPTEYSFYHWASAALAGGGLEAVHYFTGVLLLIGWTILIFATQSSLDIFGMILAAALLGTGVWLLIDLGVLRADSLTAVTWIVLICVAAVLAIGLSWSHIWRRLTGQVDIAEENG